MIDSITSLLGLKDKEVEYCKEVIKNKTHFFYIRLINRGMRCHNCGTYTRNIKEYRDKRIRHSILLNEPCEIIYNARRFVCPKCGKTFYENNPFTNQYSKISDYTIDNTLQLLKNYNETFSSVARKVNLSKTQVINIFDEHVQINRKELSLAIGIDEFYFSRHARRKYALMILSLNKGYVVDLLPSREKHRMRSYFHRIPKEERQTVKFVSIDMNENFREIVKDYFPWAKLCADPFHVMRLVNDALDKIRIKTLHQYDDNRRSDEYYLLKYQKHLLFHDIEYQNFTEVKRNHHFKFTLTDLQKRNMLLSINKTLERAWQLKERYKSFNDELLPPEDKAYQLDYIIDAFISSNIPEFISVGLTLSNWKEEILNSFFTIDKKVHSSSGVTINKTVRVTSGPVEGRNKYLKIILRLANGYFNFDRFRNRAMFVLNRQESYSNHRLENTVKHWFPKKKTF